MVLVMMVMFAGKVGAQTKEAYAVLKDSTLTFYYDANKPEGAYDIYEQKWKKYNWNENVSIVIFDSSFKDYKYSRHNQTSPPLTP